MLLASRLHQHRACRAAARSGDRLTAVHRARERDDRPETRGLGKRPDQGPRSPLALAKGTHSTGRSEALCHESLASQCGGADTLLRAETAARGLALIGSTRVDLVVTAYRLPDGS